MLCSSPQKRKRPYTITETRVQLNWQQWQRENKQFELFWCIIIPTQIIIKNGVSIFNNFSLQLIWNNSVTSYGPKQTWLNGNNYKKKVQKCLPSVTSQVRLLCYCSQKFETIFKKTMKTPVVEMYISTIYTTHRTIFRYIVTTDSPRLESISLRDIVFHIFIS
jgi:hypothetical protein